MRASNGDDEVSLAITIDTEEDDWGSFAASGQTVRNIALLPRLQAMFDEWGARPTYLVNRPPLLDDEATDILRGLAERENVEIGAHCHPWNTPPDTGGREDASMMCNLPEDANLAKMKDITDRIEDRLGVRPRSFRAGRWGLGPSVARPLATLGYEVDVSVSPFIDWSDSGGPDYSTAPHAPYRFDPNRPLEPSPEGAMVQLPTTVGYLRGDPVSAQALRRRLEDSFLSSLKVVGALDRVGMLTRRWLSPETSSLRDMIRLAESCVRRGARYLDMTFHSCTLLPGATPFVRDLDDQGRFLDAIEGLLRQASTAGYRFATVTEAARALILSRT